MKQDKMVNYQKNRKQVYETETLKAIRKMADKGQEITFYAVAKATGRSTRYLYGNATIRKEIEAHRKSETPKSEETLKTESTILRMECNRLQRELEKMKEENKETWKQKYYAEKQKRNAEHQRNVNMYHENMELKRQLRSLYSASAQSAQE